jgi:hypothetical protein
VPPQGKARNLRGRWVCCIKPPAQVTFARTNDGAALRRRARRKCSRSSRQIYVKLHNTRRDSPPTVK